MTFVISTKKKIKNIVCLQQVYQSYFPTNIATLKLKLYYIIQSMMNMYDYIRYKKNFNKKYNACPNKNIK